MKLVKAILIAVEITALAGVIILAFSDVQDEEMNFFKSMYIVLLSILEVVMQKEQQDIDWDEKEDVEWSEKFQDQLE